MCPIAHVPHPPRSPICICSINQYTIYPCAPLAMCRIAHVSKRCQVVKKMSSCQKDVKCQKVKHIDYGGGSQKKEIDIMRFTHIDVNFDVKYDGHQNCSKTLSMHILRVFGDHHMWHQNWHQNVWTSLCQFIFFVNLLHSLCVWLFDIWHLFDNLTSFWQLDIFLTHEQWGTWPMGYMGNGAHLLDTFKLKPPQPITGAIFVNCVHN